MSIDRMTANEWRDAYFAFADVAQKQLAAAEAENAKLRARIAECRCGHLRHQHHSAGWCGARVHRGPTDRGYACWCDQFGLAATPPVVTEGERPLRGRRREVPAMPDLQESWDEE